MSQLTIKGTLNEEGFNPRSWTDAKGNPRNSLDFVIDYTDNGYANKLLLQAVGQKTIDEMTDSVGTGERTFHFKVTSNKSGNNWFTSAKVWRVS